MLRITLAVVAGCLAMTLLLAATQLVLLRFVFHTASADPDLPPIYLLANAVVSLFYAVVGGSICAAIGKRPEAPTILGALLLGIAIGGALMNRSGEPRWYAALVPLVGALAATVAGYRWLGTDTPPRQKPR